MRQTEMRELRDEYARIRGKALDPEFDFNYYVPEKMFVNRTEEERRKLEEKLREGLEKIELNFWKLEKMVHWEDEKRWPIQVRDERTLTRMNKSWDKWQHFMYREALGPDYDFPTKTQQKEENKEMWVGTVQGFGPIIEGMPAQEMVPCMVQYHMLEGRGPIEQSYLLYLIKMRHKEFITMFFEEIREGGKNWKAKNMELPFSIQSKLIKKGRKNWKGWVEAWLRGERDITKPLIPQQTPRPVREETPMPPSPPERTQAKASTAANPTQKKAKKGERFKTTAVRTEINLGWLKDPRSRQDREQK